jgi:hypothetical protein
VSYEDHLRRALVHLADSFAGVTIRGEHYFPDLALMGFVRDVLEHGHVAADSQSETAQVGETRRVGPVAQGCQGGGRRFESGFPL